MRRYDVDGVPFLFLERPGLTEAGLAFRVGMADEPLPMRGVTHLVEHLALFPQVTDDYHSNGATSETTTLFHMRGRDNEVVSFVNGVCQALSDLPLHRLAAEKDILRTEENGRGGSLRDAILVNRHGAVGYGASGYDELGVHGLTEQRITAWTRYWFTRGNVVGWIAGERMPPGLRLELPDGDRRPAPTVTSALAGTPAYFSSAADIVVWDAVVRRGPAAAAFARVLGRELFRTLRRDNALCYTADAVYLSRCADFATVTAVTDSLPDKQPAVIGGIVDLLAGIQLTGVEPADLAGVCALMERELNDPDTASQRLVADAVNLLRGVPIKTVEDRCRDIRAVTVDDLSRVAREAMSTALFQIPSGHRLDWAGYVTAPTESTDHVEGREFPAINRERIVITVGERGAALRVPDTTITVRYDQCVAVLAWPDGARRLVGADGFMVHIEPTLFRLDPTTIPAIDAATAALRVDMPARDEIPVPPDSEMREATEDDIKASRRAARRFPLTAALAVLFILWAGYVTFIREEPPLRWIILSWVAAVVFVYKAVDARKRLSPRPVGDDQPAG